MKESNNKSSFLQLINKTLAFIDGTVDRMGVWYRVIFTYLWSIVAIYSALQVLISVAVNVSKSTFLQKNQYITSIVAMGLFILVLVYSQRIATVVEVILSAFLVVTVALQKLNLLWFSLDGGIYLYLGIAFCGGLLAGQIFWLIVRILKQYRRSHMKKRTASSLSQSDYNSQESPWVTTVYKRENKRKMNNLDQDGFIITRSNMKTGGNSMPDSTGFITEGKNSEK